MAAEPDTMTLRVLLPVRVLLETPTRKVIAEAEDGSFCLLPRHVDYAATLAPGILCYLSPEGGERFLAVNGGVLVKLGREVRVATMDAVAGDDLARLRATVEEQFSELDELERAARSALARLEAGVIRRFVDSEAHRHGR